MHQNCEQCRHLRRAYDAATTIHLALENRLQLVTLGRDNDAIAALMVQIESAARTRANSREAIRQHESATSRREAATHASHAGSSQ